MPTDTTAVLTISVAIAIAAISPGPTLLMVARKAVSSGRLEGVVAALGVGVAGVLYAAAALAGLNTVLVSSPIAGAIVKSVGGAYLSYLGARIFSGAAAPLEQRGDAAGDHKISVGRAFRLGLATHLSNPKAVVVYASVFAAFMPGRVPPASMAAVTTAVFVVEFGWYAMVAMTLSAERSRQAYLSLKTGIDRAAGLTLVVVGSRLLWQAWIDAS